jgi:hypothetical protein
MQPGKYGDRLGIGGADGGPLTIQFISGDENL